MSATFLPATLPRGTTFCVNGRTGTSYGPFGLKVLVGWDEIVDAHTGEVLPASTDTVSAEDIGRLAQTGQLEIISIPGIGAEDEQSRRDRIEMYQPDSGLTGRALFRLSYVDATNRLIKEDVLPQNPTRRDIEDNLDAIESSRRAVRREKRKTSGGRKRAGGKEDSYIESECARSIHDWWLAAKTDPRLGVYDKYNKCGNRAPRFSEAEIEFFTSIIDEMLTVERPHLAAIVDSVKAAVLVENDRRKQLDPPQLPLRKPGRDFITKQIKRISPVDFWTRTRGFEVAYRDFHSLGEGLNLIAPLERVEIDEQTVDLSVILREAKILDALGPDGIAALDFNVSKARVTISAAIDAFTGCLLAFQVTNKPDQELTKRTIEMIYIDKTPIARAAGAASDWGQFGHPTELVMDKGATYISDETYLLLASAGITNMSLPGAHPFLKGNIEGWFRTLSGKLMPHLVGRTFKDVVAKGENDPESRAVIDIDTFLRMLTCWVVDVYHNTRPSRLGSRTPVERWNAAMSEVPPNIRTDVRRLRKVFGNHKTRTISQRGILVGGVYYQSEALAEWYHSKTQRDVDVWWWHCKIGAIEVVLPDGTPISVPCRDPRWSEASYADFIAWQDSIGDLDPDVELIAAKALRAIDQEVLPMKRRLHGLLPLKPTDAELRRREADMQRFMQTQDRERPEARGLFSDVVNHFSPGDRHTSGGSGTEIDSANPTDPDDYSDILE